MPRKSVVRLTDHPHMTLAVYCGRKTTTIKSYSMDKAKAYQPRVAGSVPSFSSHSDEV